jgi:hypothetical protein
MKKNAAHVFANEADQAFTMPGPVTVSHGFNRLSADEPGSAMEEVRAGVSTSNVLEHVSCALDAIYRSMNALVADDQGAHSSELWLWSEMLERSKAMIDASILGLP